MPSEWCAATVIATDESMRVSSSTAIAYESVSAPAPPYSSGIVIPISPSSASSRDELVREPLLAVELLGDRRDLLERELPHRVAQQLVLGLEVEVQRGEPLRELDDQPHAVARAALVERVVGARALEDTPGRRCRSAPTGPSPVNSRRNSAASTAPPSRSSERVLHVGEVRVDVAAVARMEREAPGEVAARARRRVDLAPRTPRRCRTSRRSRSPSAIDIAPVSVAKSTMCVAPLARA